MNVLVSYRECSIDGAMLLSQMSSLRLLHYQVPTEPYLREN